MRGMTNERFTARGCDAYADTKPGHADSRRTQDGSAIQVLPDPF
jgi:hypothetical protein